MTVTGLAFMFAFLAALVVALVRYPIVGLYTYVAVFYLHPPSRWWGEFLPDLRWSMLSAFVTFVAILWRLPKETDGTGDQREPWYSTTPAKIMIVFLLWYWLMYLWAMDQLLHYNAGVLITKYLLVFWMVYRLIDTPGKLTGFLLVHLLGCFYLGFLGFSSADGSSRLDGVGGPGIDDSNTLGMHLATGAICGAMLILMYDGWKNWKKWMCAIAVVFAMNTVVLTGSRGAFLALVAGGVVLWYLRPVVYKKQFMGYAVLGVLAFGYVASGQFWERMNTMSAVADDNQQLESSAQSRVEMFKAQWEMAKRHPLGAGHRGSEVMSAQFLDHQYLTAGGARSSHNVLMTVLVEQGIPGVLISVFIIAWVARTLRRLKRESVDRNDPLLAVHSAAVGGALMVVFVGGFFADFSKCEVQIWMFALLAVLEQRIGKVHATVPRVATPSTGRLPSLQP